MGMLNKNKYYDKLSQYDKDKIMALEVLKRLGKTNRIYSNESFLKGGYYEETKYEDENFIIASTIFEDLYIVYDNEKVFSYNLKIAYNELQNENVYVPGTWESYLEDIYKNVPSLIYNRGHERAYREHATKAMYLIDFVGECDIDDSLKIIKKDEYYGDNNEYFKRTHYNVYKDHCLVFSGDISYDKICNIIKYNPGSWENELKEYRDYILFLKEEKKKERNRVIANNSIRRYHSYK